MLFVCPCTLEEANCFVRRHHRHHQPVPGCKFCVAVSDDENVVGVAIVGRPTARNSDDGFTLEVVRCCTDGKKNACSMLYTTAWRAARALGYRQLITFTMESEGGASLRAAGWKLIGKHEGRSWSCPSRPRVDKHPMQQKWKWSA